MSKLQKAKTGHAWTVFRNYLLMTVGAIIYGIAIAVFLDPNQLAPGGVSGLSIILNTLLPIGTGVWILLINVPLLIAALIVFKFKFLIGTLYATLLSSAVIEIVDRGFSKYIPDMSDHMLIASLAGGAMLALGIGLVFRGGGSTGGFDIVVKILRRKFRHMKTGGLYLILDCVVIVLSAIVFRNVLVAMYAVVTCVTNSTLLDVVLYGKDNAKMIYIISDHPEEVSARLMQEVETGVTMLYGEGAYTKKDKKVLMCVVRNQQYPMVRDVVKQEDKHAFLIVTKATEIFGEGYKSQDAEEL